jgi:hypothetical protein
MGGGGKWEEGEMGGGGNGGRGKWREGEMGRGKWGGGGKGEMERERGKWRWDLFHMQSPLIDFAVLVEPQAAERIGFAFLSACIVAL